MLNSKKIQTKFKQNNNKVITSRQDAAVQSKCVPILAASIATVSEAEDSLDKLIAFAINDLD